MQKRIIFIFLMLLSSVALASYMEAGGVISSDTSWTADTVKVIDNLVINPNITLTIAAGTVVEFQGWFGINVSGTVRAQGNVADSITFYFR